MEGPMLVTPTPRSVSGVGMEEDTTLPDRFNPCITDTFLEVPSVEIVVVPWRVFQIFPEIMHPNFRSDNGQITYDDDANIFMTDTNLQPSKYGHMEDFTQTWVVQVTTADELERLTVRLSTFPSLMSVALTARNILEDSLEIPMVVFLSPDSQCIRDLVTSLGRAKEHFRSGKKFSVEVDIGPSMEDWGKRVLRREFLSVGGRVCITSGAMFNHVFDWNNILGCVPCLPCGLVGSSVYRLHRKINYKDQLINDMAGIAILGCKGMAFSNQRHAVYLLMQWIRVFKMYYCIDCRKRVPLDENQKESDSFCKCDNRPSTASSLGKRNKVHPHDSVGGGKGSSSSRMEEGVSSPRDKSDAAASGQSGDLDSEDDNTRRAGDSAVGQNKDTDPAGLSQGQGQGQGRGQGHGEGAAAGTGASGGKNNDTTGRSPAKKKDEKAVGDDTPDRFACYKESAAGTAIARKKWMLAQNPIMTRTDKHTSMGVLKTKRPGGFVPMRTVFKYPKHLKPRKGRRPGSSGFVEIELKRTEGGMYEDDIEEEDETEMHSPRRRIYIDGDEDDEGFYFLEDEGQVNFDEDPLGQVDLKRFLVHISDPKTRTLSPSFDRSNDRAITNQPGTNTESSA